MRSKRFFKKRRILLYGVALLLILLAGGSLYEVRSDTFRDLALHFIQSLCDRRIEVGEASFNLLGRVTLRDVRIHNPPGYSSPLFFTAPRIVFHMGMTGGETSAFRPVRISIHDPIFHYQRTDSLSWNSEGLWAKKPPRHDHPTFVLPIAIHGAAVHYTDSRVGRSGVQISFPRVDADFSVFSDGAEIKNRLTATDVAAPGGGTIDLILSSHPAASRSEVSMTLKRVSLRTIAPFYDFLTLLHIEQGRASGTYRMELDTPQVTRTVANLTLDELRFRHVPSGASFDHATAGLTFSTVITETEIALAGLEIRWKNSRIEAAGRFSPRAAAQPFSEILFTAREAQGEDLAFLLATPGLAATGPVTGECRLTGAPGRNEYAASLELTRADVRYAGFIAKPRGIHGRLAIKGHGGERASTIDIELSSSRARLTPSGAGWALRGERLAAADASRYVVPLAELGGVALSGSADLALQFLPGGVISGEADLTGLGITTDNGLTKPEAHPMRATLEATIVERGIIARRCLIDLGGGRVSLEGGLGAARSNLRIGVLTMNWKSARIYAPRLMNGIDARFSLDGEFNGAITALRESRNPEESYSVVMNLEGSRLELKGLGAKPRGLAAGINVTGRPLADGFRIDGGYAYLGNTRLAAHGEWSGDAVDLRLKGTATGIDGLKTLLASQLWPGFRRLETSGTSNLDVAISGRGDALKVDADLEATEASLAYGDTWAKPSGEPFRVRLLLNHADAGTEVERLEFVQGTSRFFCEGRIGLGRPAAIDAKIRADVDVAAFTRRAPALERIRIEGRKASEALAMIAESNGRATLNWQLSGTIDEPKLSLMMDQIMSRALVNAISQQMKAFSRMLIVPFRIGTEVIRDALGNDTVQNN